MRRLTEFARRDLEAMGSLLDGAVAMARRWTELSASGRQRIFPGLSRVDVARRLAAPLPVKGLTPKRILSEIERNLLPFLRDNGSPRFFGYVMSPPSAAGVAADLIASAVDQNVTAWRSTPGATELERLVVDWMRSIAGLPAGAGGILTSGGSMATLTALTAARASRAPESTTRSGMGALGDRLMTLYVSDQVHMSVPRAAQLLGLGTAAVRVIPTDARFRIDVHALEEAIQDDRRAGQIPFCIVANAGTVNSGAVDPLARIAAVARRHRLWLHVDAAYGGPLRLSRGHRSLLEGIEEADSITLDPHKWLYAPVDAGCVLFRNPQAAASAFGTTGDYAAVLESGERESFAFFHQGPELSRRFRALKIWMILKYHGTARLGRRLDEEMDLARHLAGLFQSHDETELMAPVETAIVCFRYVPPALRFGPPPTPPPSGEERRRPPPAGPDRGRRGMDLAVDQLNREICLAVQRAGAVYLSNATLKGRFVLRACVMNFRTTRADVVALFKEVLAQGRRLSA